VSFALGISWWAQRCFEMEFAASKCIIYRTLYKKKLASVRKEIKARYREFATVFLHLHRILDIFS
jgi:hypothetical protein